MPPLVGVAVNVTGVPGQIEPEGFAAIFMTGVSVGLTTIVTELDVAVAGEAQTAFEVITTVIISPFDNAVLVKVEAFVPVLTPLICH